MPMIRPAVDATTALMPAGSTRAISTTYWAAVATAPTPANTMNCRMAGRHPVIISPPAHKSGGVISAAIYPPPVDALSAADLEQDCRPQAPRRPTAWVPAALY